MSDRHLRQEWRTPDDFFCVLNNEFGFELDAAATRENAKCPHFLSPDTDALAEAWLDRFTSVFCNPGFSNLMPWIEKAHIESARASCGVVVVVALCSPSTRWWACAEEWATEIRLLRPRVQFEPPPGIKPSSNARENVAVVFRKKPACSPRARIWTWDWPGTRER